MSSIREKRTVVEKNNPSAEASRIGAALSYAARGWKVFPLHSVRRNPEGEFLSCTCGKSDCAAQGKHPRTKNGVRDATAETGVIAEWWGKWPDANVGVACGPESNVLMVGPNGEEGRRQFDDLCRENGTSAEVSNCRAATQSGGAHHLFAYPADSVGLGNYANHRGLKIDTRAANGYFVAAPSEGPKGGYRWELAPGSEPLPPAPSWLVEWCRKSAPAPASVPAVKAGAVDPLVLSRASKWLAKVPGAVSKDRAHPRTFEAARGVVYGFDLGEEAGYDLLMREYNPRCVNDKGAPYPWSAKEMWHKVRDANTKPFDKPRGYLLNAAKVEKPAFGEPPDPGIGLKELMKTEFDPLKYLVGGILPAGLTVMAGAPKSGKSWLALEIGIAVAGGYPCLGGQETEKAPVLGLFLEDNRRRLKDRAKKLLDAYTWATPEGMNLRCRSHSSGDGGLYNIAEWFDTNPGGLAIVDTLQRFRDPKRGQEGAYANDYAALGALHSLARDKGGAVLVLHHTRKAEADNPFDRISGTQGIGGAADTMLVLDRSDKVGTLWARGRDLPDTTFALKYDAGLWSVTGEEEGTVTAGVPGDSKPGPKPEATPAAVKWLSAYLAGGRKPTKEVESAAEAAGHKEKTLKQARKELGVLHEREGFGGGSVVYLNLPGDVLGRDKEPPTPLSGNWAEYGKGDPKVTGETLQKTVEPILGRVPVTGGVDADSAPNPAEYDGEPAPAIAPILGLVPQIGADTARDSAKYAGPASAIYGRWASYDEWLDYALSDESEEP